MSYVIFRSREVAIPYRLNERPGGSDRLLVFFPRLRPNGARPNRALAARLEDVDAHQLLLGGDEHLFVGPRRRLLGRDAAVELIARERELLGVAPAAVTALGTSMGGIMALLIGLPARAGHIIAGGAPIKMGKTLERFDRLDGPSSAAKAASQSLIALADNGDGRAVAWLNKAIFNEARAATSKARIDLFGSEGDRTIKSMAAFATEFAAHEHLDVSLTVADYGRHRDIVEPFVDFVRSVVAERASRP